MTQTIPQPDLSQRPHDSHAERWTHLSPQRLYRAWTLEWDAWFAKPGTVVMDPQPGQPWFGPGPQTRPMYAGPTAVSRKIPLWVWPAVACLALVVGMLGGLGMREAAVGNLHARAVVLRNEFDG